MTMMSLSLLLLLCGSALVNSASINNKLEHKVNEVELLLHDIEQVIENVEKGKYWMINFIKDLGSGLAFYFL